MASNACAPTARADCPGHGATRWTLRPGRRQFLVHSGKFGFCPCCLDQPHPSMRERSKLAGLSGEGRSSAPRTLCRPPRVDEWRCQRRSRREAKAARVHGQPPGRALQAGHFNDYLFVSLLRGAILRAVIDAGSDGMAEDEFGLRVVKALGFTASNKDARIHWMLDPEAGAAVRRRPAFTGQGVCPPRLDGPATGLALYESQPVGPEAGRRRVHRPRRHRTGSRKLLMAVHPHSVTSTRKRARSCSRKFLARCWKVWLSAPRPLI